MASLAVFRFTVIFLLFTLSYARFITVVAEQDVSSEESVTELPESNHKTTNTILLPSEKPGFEPAKVVDSNPDDGLETGSDVDSVPLTMISFRPVNRHFPRRPSVPFRHKHDCRFHRRPLNPRFMQTLAIPYGNDMLRPDERTRFDPESRGVVRQIQARWARFPNYGGHFKQYVDFLKPNHNDHKHEHEHDHDEDHHHRHHPHRIHHHGEDGEDGDKDEREEHEHEGGFMRKFRKFLIHF